MYSSFNPYQSMYNNNQMLYGQPQQTNLNKQEVIRVNGKNGAEAYQLPPNSSILLLDETAPIVWLKMTDGAGYPTLSPYDISPHKTQTSLVEIDTESLEKRIARLEEIVNELSQSNAEPSQPIKRVISVSKESKSN